MTSASDARSGGVESKQDRKGADCAADKSARPSAGVNTQRDADDRGKQQGGGGENRGVACAFAQQIRHGPRVEQRFAEVEPYGPRDPPRVLNGSRIVESQLVAARLQHGRIDPEIFGHKVAGRGKRQQRGEGGNDEDENDREGRPADAGIARATSPRHCERRASRTANVSALHVRLGRVSAGVRLISRALAPI